MKELLLIVWQSILLVIPSIAGNSILNNINTSSEKMRIISPSTVVENMQMPISEIMNVTRTDLHEMSIGLTYERQDTILPDAIQEYGFKGIAGSEYGTTVASAGDVNADGYEDIIVGAPIEVQGKAYVYFGGPVVEYQADVVLTGQFLADAFGISVAGAGDVNNDGYDDVIVGAPDYSQSTGRAYIYFGGNNMNNVADVILTGSQTFSYLGYSVASAGDPNGDSYSDVIVGSTTNTANLFFGGNPMNNVADVIFFESGSGLGQSVSSAGDVNSDGYSDIILGAYLRPNGIMQQAGAAMIFYGGLVVDNIPDKILSGVNAYDRFGVSVSYGGDVNNDGFSDVIVGAYHNSDAGSNAGKAYVYIGGVSMDLNPDVIMSGKQSNDEFGISVSYAGDVNGDGFDDVIAGAARNDEGGVDAGRAYMYFGGAVMNNIEDNLFTGKYSGDGFGCQVAHAGDFNNDGYGDLIIGAYRNDEGGNNAGKAYLYTNTVNSSGIFMQKFDGSVALQRFGYSVSGAGDVNGDGFEDFVVGQGDLVSNLPAKVYFGGMFVDNVPDVSLFGSAFVSFRVGNAGDVNNDGYDDIITADPFNSVNGTEAGAAFIFYGSNAMSGVPSVTLYGTAAGNHFGYAISCAGDVNNDGFDDVIVGAPDDDDGGPDAGSAFIYFGSANMNNVPDIAFTGETPNGKFGSMVSDGGKLNNDSYHDVIVGAPYYSVIDEEGRAYVYLGGANMNNTADLIMTGTAQNSYLGWSADGASDFNGDSYDDFILGELEGPGRKGKVYVYNGGNTIDNIPDLTLAGENNSFQFGGSVACPGDINNDGYGDIVVGESQNSSSQPVSGRVSVYYGGSAMNSVADRIIYGEADLDVFGYSVSGTGDVDGDGFNEIIISSPYKYLTGQNMGRVYLFKSSETGTDIDDQYFAGTTGDQLGYSVSSAGDINLDGYDDVIVGALYNAMPGFDAGRAYIYYCGPLLDKIPDVTLSGAAPGDHFGTSVSGAGDVNQDGYPDVIVGAPDNDAGGLDAGRAYIYFGGPGMNNVPDVLLTGQTAGDRFGFSVSVSGSVNSDGVADAIVGAPFYDGANVNSGRAYVFLGGASMDNVPDVTLSGSESGEWLGISCAGAGDVNGDSFGDVLIGASMHDSPPSNNKGKAYLLYGGSSMNNVPDVILGGALTGDNFGYSVSGAGDVNGDLFSDIIIGAYSGDYNTGTDAGATYVYYGGVNMNNVPDVVMMGASAFDFLGISVSSAGDVNNDYYDDVVIGACYNDAGGSNSGRAYILYGGNQMNNVPDIIMTGRKPGDNFGWSVANGGDQNADGKNDPVIGANFNDDTGIDAGKAYLHLSSGPADHIILTLKVIPEGLYNDGTDKLNLSDTVTVSLHNSSSPFNQMDLTKGVINQQTFTGRFFFQNVLSGNYYVRVRHRNCIDTWSSSPVNLIRNVNENYDFTSAAYQAFGFNEVLVDSYYFLFGIYSGDVNRDGTVDATDLSIIDNDAMNFASGYMVTDLTGDYFVDAADFSIADNNATNFVSVIQP